MENSYYPIGTQYLSSGKCPRICTVVDHHFTYNSKNELIKMRYVATHNFMGQEITDCDVVAVSIARGLERKQREVV